MRTDVRLFMFSLEVWYRGWCLVGGSFWGWEAGLLVEAGMGVRCFCLFVC